MRRFPHLLFWTFCFQTVLSGQYADLLRDPDITWVAEYTTDFVMNPENEDDLYPQRPNYLDVIQFRNSGAENGLYGRKIYARKYLSRQFFQEANLPKFPCYEDSLVRNPMTPKEIFNSMTKTDTGYNMCYNDPVIIVNEVHCDEIWCFRVRQIFWYDKRKKAFDARLLSYAPMVEKYDDNGNWAGTRPLYWLKAGAVPRSFKNRHFTYIFQTKMANNAPRFEDFTVLKGSIDFKKLFEAEMRHPSHPCLDASEYQPTGAAALTSACFGADTLVTFQPETYKAQTSIENRNCIEQIERVRFVHNWYYDEKHQRLCVRLAGIAPLAAVRDSEGELRFYKPLFYQMYR